MLRCPPAGSNLPISVPLGDSLASGGGIGSTDHFPDLGTVLAKCDIAEIAVYDTVIPYIERLSIERYLSNKYSISLTAIEGSQDGYSAEAFRLYQNYPNPFNPSTTIRYSVPHRSHVMLTVFNTLGQRVAVLVNGEIDAGYHVVQFNASNLASGVYFCRLQAGSFLDVKKLVLTR